MKPLNFKAQFRETSTIPRACPYLRGVPVTGYVKVTAFRGGLKLSTRTSLKGPASLLSKLPLFSKVSQFSER